MVDMGNLEFLCRDGAQSSSADCQLVTLFIELVFESYLPLHHLGAVLLSPIAIQSLTGQLCIAAHSSQLTARNIQHQLRAHSSKHVAHRTQHTLHHTAHTAAHNTRCSTQHTLQHTAHAAAHNYLPGEPSLPQFRIQAPSRAEIYGAAVAAGVPAP